MAEYDPQKIEQKWQQFWENQGTFHTPVAPAAKDKLYILDMFPYPSGAGLHVGHPLGYTGTDIVCRYQRMRGKQVLHPMGWDAFGLPAEQHAIATGEHPAAVTKRNCESFKRQLGKVGISFDWSREIATCDPDYYRWTQWIFLKIFNSWFDEQSQRARPIEELPIPPAISAAGAVAVAKYKDQHRLAYYADATVNWCPALGTVLANEEVINGRSERGNHEVIRKPMKQWMMRITAYAERLLKDLDLLSWPSGILDMQRNWIGRKEGAEIVFALPGRTETLTAFTTRPDTICGVTFFVIAPEHPLVDLVTTPSERAAVTAYRAAAARLSDLDRTLETREKTGVFTGSSVVNPVTGTAVPLFVGDYVLANVGTGAVMGVPAHDERDFAFAKKFKLPIVAVVEPASPHPDAERIIAGEVCFTEPGKMIPGRSGAALDGKANTEAAAAIVASLAERKLGKGVVTYKLRDWVFSRQRYWGEPIPVIHWEDGTTTGLSEQDLPLVLPEVPEYKPSADGESPLARAGSWLTVTCPTTGKRGRRETNTMPNWAGSCWYYLRFVDPHNATRPWDRAIEKSWLPVDLYVGGAEHAVLHLLYARFWHKVLFDCGEVSTPEPFARLFNQGMIQAFAFRDGRGALVPTDQVTVAPDGTATKTTTGERVEQIVAKMSKSLRNVVGLEDTVNHYGADVMRTYLMFMGPLDTGRVWDPQAITGNVRFLRRMWTLVTGNQDTGHRGAPEEPRLVTKAVHKLCQRVTHDIEQLSFNTCIAAMMEFLNLVGDQPITLDSLKRVVLLLSPFAPHLAEELWQRLGGAQSLAYEPWPTFDPALCADDIVTVVVQVTGKKRATVDVAPSITDEELRGTVVQALAGTSYAAKPSDKFITVYHQGTKTPRLVNVIPQ